MQEITDVREITDNLTPTVGLSLQTENDRWRYHRSRKIAETLMSKWLKPQQLYFISRTFCIEKHNEFDRLTQN
jgi:hypothetical protein